MDRNRAEYDLLVQQIDHLKRSFCPERYRYTHEYLDLALTAARREAPGIVRSNDEACDVVTRGLADPLIVH